MLPHHPESPAPRGTPARRRQNRVPSTRSPANKAYASESDMPSELQFPIEMPSGNGSPFATPQKSASNSPAPQAQSQSTNGRPPKARNSNKPRPKSGAAPSSPGPSKQHRKTPPNGLPAKPPTATAYAGATFHASPAPSSLPLPSFLPKAMDSPLAKDTGRASLQPSPPLSDSEAPTPRQTSALVREVSREDSPLDLFFRADREEKERARRASTANVVANPPGPYSPPSNNAQYPQQPSTVPNKQPTILSRRDLFNGHASVGRIAATELDGTPGQPMGPAFSTPYAERMRAARANGQQSERNNSAPQQPSNHSFPQFSSPMRQTSNQSFTQQPPATKGIDAAEGLKRLLGVGSPSTSVVSPASSENTHPHVMAPQRLFSDPAPQTQHMSPAQQYPQQFPQQYSQHQPQQYPPQYIQQYSQQYPQQYAQQQPHMPQPSGASLNPRSQSPKPDMAHLEDHLRRMLKLDAAGGAPLTL